MKKSLLLLTLMVLLTPWAVKATEVEILGDGGETTNSYLPAYTLYTNTLSEQIYTAQEVGMAGTITSISFFNGGSDKTPELNIYLVNTAKSEFSSTTDWLEVAAENLVFSGSVAFTAGEWTTIELTSDFEYDGTSNLGLIVDEHMTWSSGLKCRVFTSTSNCSMYVYSDGTDYNAVGATYTASGRLGVKNQIKLDITPAGGTVCEKPETLEVSDVTAHEANLAWTGTVGAYDVEYKKASDEAWTVALQASSETSLTLDNLEPLTSYSVRVRSVCGSEDFSGYKTSSFTTQAGIPLVEPFATANLPANWSKYTGLLSDVMAGSATLSSGGSWYFGTSNGVFDSHARVNVYGTGCKYWLVAPALLMEDNVQLTFDLALTAYSGDLAAPATSGTDDKFVVLISADNGATWTILRQWDNAGSEDVYNDIACTAAGQQVAIDLSSYQGQSVCIAFYCESTVDNADNNLHIDNVRIDYIPDCAIPTALAVSEITAHTAQLSWTDDAASEWVIAYKKAADTDFTEIEGVTENPYTLTGLVGETAYEVKIKANCGDAQSEFTASKNFTTLIACQKPTALAAQITPGNGSIATLSWNAGGEETEWIIEYCTNNTFEGDDLVEVTDITENPFTLDGLTAETTYFARVKANCGDEDGVSKWSNVVSFTPTDAFVLTVNDGTSTNSYIPFYYYVVSNKPRSQFIIPAFDLAGIQWATLNKFTLYNSSASVSYGDAEFSVYVAEVSSTTLSAFADWASLTEVYNGKLSVEDNKMEIEFATPYQYSGGNLLVGFYTNKNGTSASYSDTWIGKSGVSGCSRYHTGGTSSSETASTFLPKVTIDFTPGEAPSCLPPTNLAAASIPGEGTKATLSWNAGGEETEWIIEYSESSDFEGANQVQADSNPFVLEGLTEETTYYARVKADCGDDQSDWSFAVSFAPTAKVVIGSGDATNSYLPTYTFYNYSLTQQIYTAEELGDAGFISSIDFKCDSETSRNIDIYMVSTEKSSFSGATDWIPVTVADRVFSGEISFAANAWTTIELDGGFIYDGTSNIAIIIDDNTGSYKSGPKFFTFAATSQALRIYSDETNYDPSAPSSYTGTVMNEKNQIRLVKGEIPSCLPPTGLAVEYNGGTEATISWISDASSFNMKVNGTPIDAVINTPSYTLSDLELATTYSIEVQANCGTATSDWTSAVSFTTDACLNPFIVNYDLADSYGDGWNGDAAILVSDGDQTVETLTLASGYSKTGSLKLCGEYFEFSWHKGTYDGECSFEITDGNNEPLYSIESASSLTEGQVLFTLGHLSCAKPEMPIDDPVSGSSSAELSWIERGDATAWKLAYKKAADEEFTEIDADANPFVLDGLDAETDYVFKVRPICDDEAIKWSEEKQFSTQANCPTPSNLHVVGAIPYNDTIAWTGSTDVQNYNVEYRTAASREFIDESFESGALPAGWTIEGNGTWTVGTGDYNASTGAHSGSYNAKINHGTTGNVTYLVTPVFDLSGKSELSLGLWYVNRAWAGDKDGFGVCYRVNGGEWNELFATTDAHADWTELNQPLPAGALVANCQIGFRFTDAYGYGVGLDDITLGDLLPVGEWQSEEVSETSIALSVDPLKKYEVRVKSECAGDEGWSDTLSFFAEAKEFVTITAAGYATYYNSFAYVMPANVEGYAFGSAPLQYNKVFDGATQDVVASETPLILKGNEGSYEIVPAAAAGSKPADNLLIGVHSETWVSDETDKLFYVLSLAKPGVGQDPDPSTAGFYWYKEDGSGNFYVPAKKAYLKLDASVANNAPGFIFDENGATSLDNLKGVEGTLKFIQDGNIYILREGVIYDATGRKVRTLE